MGRWVTGIVAAVTVLAGCGDDSNTDGPVAADGLRVAAFDFVESEILAEVYAQSAESVGIPVVRLGAVGPREVMVPALRNGAVDLVPEYLGSALRFEGIDDPPAAADDAIALLTDRVDSYGIEVLDPAPAVDSNVFVVSAAAAVRHGLTSISDLADAPLTRLGGPAECVERELCMVGLSETYGITFEEFVTQPSLLFTAEAIRRDEIDVGVMFSTAPEVDAADIVVLDDDRRLQPPENVVPVVRVEALERWEPELRDALGEVSSRLTTSELRRLNAEVAAGTPVVDVVREWFTPAG